MLEVGDFVYPKKSVEEASGKVIRDTICYRIKEIDRDEVTLVDFQGGDYRIPASILCKMPPPEWGPGDVVAIVDYGTIYTTFLAWFVFNQIDKTKWKSREYPNNEKGLFTVVAAGPHYHKKEGYLYLIEDEHGEQFLYKGDGLQLKEKAQSPVSLEYPHQLLVELNNIFDFEMKLGSGEKMEIKDVDKTNELFARIAAYLLES